MPKILRIINRFNLGGPTYNVSYLTKYMDTKFETLLIGGVHDNGETDSYHIFERLGLKPRILTDLKRNPNISDDLKAYSEIKKIIEEFKPDIVHTHASKAGALGRMAALKMKVPIIVHTYHGHVFEGYFGGFKTWIYKTIERFLAKKSTGIIAISPEQTEDLFSKHKICPKDKIRTIGLGFDLDRFHENLNDKRQKTRANFNLQSDDIAIAIIGRLAPIKNHRLFLSAIKTAAISTNKKLSVFIVGDGSELEDLKYFSNDLNEIPNVKVHFTSWILDIENFDPGMDIICLTSNNEGTPVSLIEAQASGVAVLSTEVGGVKHVVEDKITGLLVPPNDLEAFTEKLLLLIEDKEMRDFLSQNGWNAVKDKFHYLRLVRNMEEYYDELLEKKANKVR